MFSNCTNFHVIKSVPIADVFHATIDSVELLFIWFLHTFISYLLFLLLKRHFFNIIFDVVCTELLLPRYFLFSFYIFLLQAAHSLFTVGTKLNFLFSFFSSFCKTTRKLRFPFKEDDKKHTPLFFLCFYFTHMN